MTVYTFEVQWPKPFNQDWLRSNVFDVDIDNAAKRMADYLSISLQNGTVMTARLIALSSREAID